MYRDIFEFCVQCATCIEASSQKFKTNLHPFEIGSPWDTLSIDILESPSSKYGYGYFLVMQDHFIKCLEAAPIKSQSAETVVREVKKLIFRFGFPRRIHSDMGRNFESFLFKNLCEACGVHKTRTTPYHPQGNGLVERSNRTLINMFRKLLLDESDLECKLPIILHEYNTSIHKI
ncbi:Pol polyprotein [Thelohanellus kitauei]|nr:Pol polyprotein [Thelohanellus kitauei]